MVEIAKRLDFGNVGIFFAVEIFVGIEPPDCGGVAFGEGNEVAFRVGSGVFGCFIACEHHVGGHVVIVGEEVVADEAYVADGLEIFGVVLAGGFDAVVARPLECRHEVEVGGEILLAADSEGVFRLVGNDVAVLVGPVAEYEVIVAGRITLFVGESADYRGFGRDGDLAACHYILLRFCNLGSHTVELRGVVTDGDLVLLIVGAEGGAWLLREDVAVDGNCHPFHLSGDLLIGGVAPVGECVVGVGWGGEEIDCLRCLARGGCPVEGEGASGTLVSFGGGFVG